MASVCVLPSVPPSPFLFPQPSTCSFCCEVGMTWEFLPSLGSFHKLKQGARERKLTCQQFTRAPQDAKSSLSLDAKVALSILMLPCMIWIMFYSVCNVIETRLQYRQKPGDANSRPQSIFLPHPDLLFIATYYEWQILWPIYSHSTKISLDSKGCLTQTGLLWSPDSPRNEFRADFLFLP